MRQQMQSWLSGSCLLMALITGMTGSAMGASGSWTNDGAGNWSVTGKWAGGTMADGAGTTAWFTNNITAARTITVNTNDRTLGILNIGDADDTHKFTIAASGGARLILATNGANAQINQISTSAGDTISTPLALSNSVDIANASTNVLTISGSNSCLVAGVVTIANVGAGTGGVAISGVISNGAGTVAVLQNSANSQLTLSGANSFTGGVIIKAGTLKGMTTTNALGFGLITIGDTSGSANATLIGGLPSGTSYTNPIAVASNNTGIATISNAGNGQQWAGPVTLYNHDLMVLTPGELNLRFIGGITGTGNLTLATSGSGAPYGAIILQTAPVNNVGSITNSSTGSAPVQIAGGVGANVTAITENSTNSSLTIDTTILTVNSSGTTLANNNASGSALFTVAFGVNGTGDLILKNNSAIADGITISTRSITNIGRVVNSGSGTGDTLISAAIGPNVSQVVQNSGTSPLILSGANTYTGGTTISNGVLRLDGSIGTGLVTINNGGSFSNNGTIGGPVTINSGGLLASTGTIAGPVGVNGGTLQGNGTISGIVTNYSGGTISPGVEGTAGGTLTMANLIWNGGSTCKFEIASISNNEAGAGVDYDQISVTGSLTAASVVVLRMDSLGQTLGFQTNKNYSLKVITCGATATLNPANVTLDTNAFKVGGTWSVTNLNNCIYVVCMGATSTNANYWIGTGTWSTAANWSKGHAPLPGEDVTFDFRVASNCTANIVSNNLGSITLAAGYTGTVTFATNAVAGGMNLTVAGDVAVYGGNLVFSGNTNVINESNGGTAGNPFGIGYAVQASNILIGAGGSINADNQGFPSVANNTGMGPGKGSCYRGASYGGAGCARLDLSGLVAGGPPASCYGIAAGPTALGSSAAGSAAPGKPGGGAIKLIVSGTTTVNGALSADATLTLGANSAGSSGGSIWITGGILQGAGRISAKSLAAPAYGYGGGGRIDISGVTNNFTGTLDVSYVSTMAAYRGFTGSLLLPQSTGTGLTMNNFVPYTNVAFGNSLTFTNPVVITNGVTLILEANTNQDTFTFTSLTIATNSTVQCNGNISSVNPGAGGTVSNPYGEGITVFATNITINAGGTLTAAGRGQVQGPGVAGTSGTYGGLSGAGAGVTYGSISNVTALGSGTGVGANSGVGGGAIKLVVTGTLSVDGGISSAGGTPSGSNTRGSSGGSLWIDCATLTGAGTISANGGNGIGTYAQYGGSGGRIHIAYTTKNTPNPLDNGGVTVYGGPGTSKSAAGTILVVDRGLGDQYGTLIINNNAVASNLVTTLLPTNTDCFVGTPPSVTVDRVYVLGNGVLELPSGKTLAVTTTFSNSASFLADTNSTVAFVGTNDAVIYGNITNANFSISNSVVKTVRFQVGSTNTVNQMLSLQQATLLSTTAGQWAYLYLDPVTGTQNVRRVTVQDNNATNGQTIVVKGSGQNLGHNVNWVFPSGGTIYVVQ